jgi:hypothetical protein
MPLMGSPMFMAKLVMPGPIFTKKLLLMALNNQYARFKSVLEACLKAISVFSNDNVPFAGRGVFCSADMVQN